MKVIINGFLVLVLGVTLAACGKGGGSANNGGTNSLPSYTEAEFTTDLQKLNATEKGLEDVGLKFKTDFADSNGMSTTTFSWDMDFLESYFRSHPSASQKDMIPALENYVKVANAYTQKYSTGFNLKKSDGTVEAKQLLETVKKGIDAKVDVANKTINKLKAS